jgi:hypothetical protein
MHIERIFALIRKSCAQKVPNLERVVASGYLCQVLSEHMNLGGSHPAVTTRKELVAAGCPISSAAERPEANPNMARGHLLFIREWMLGARAELGCEVLQLDTGSDTPRQLAMNAWRDLPQQVQDGYCERARNEIRPQID